MVLNVGRAKNISSLINGDTAGGIKKQGLPSTIGRVASINNVFANRIGCSLNCPIILGQGTSNGYRIGRKIGRYR